MRDWYFTFDLRGFQCRLFGHKWWYDKNNDRQCKRCGLIELEKGE